MPSKRGSNTSRHLISEKESETVVRKVPEIVESKVESKILKLNEKCLKKNSETVEILQNRCLEKEIVKTLSQKRKIFEESSQFEDGRGWGTHSYKNVKNSEKK